MIPLFQRSYEWKEREWNTRIRHEPVEAVMLPLLAQVHGPEEELDEQNSRDRYVGASSPQATGWSAAAP